MDSKQHRQRQPLPRARRTPSPAALDASKPSYHQPTSEADSVLFLQRTIGNQATTALLQRQEEENQEGSATVVGSASKSETAIDESSFTSGVTEEQAADKTPSDAELEESLKKRSREAHKVNFKTQHPSFAQLGIRPKEIKGKKLAAYIGNEKYKETDNWDPLPGAKADAQRMESTMKGHQYKTLEHANDKTAPGIQSVFNKAMGQSGAGDALLLYYAGHGIPGGVAGVNAKVETPIDDGQGGSEGGRGVKQVKTEEPDATTENTSGETKKEKEANIGSYKGHKISDIASYSSLMGPIEAGVGKGVHTTFISDACHSGTATDLVRQKAVEKISEGGKDEKTKAVTSQISRLKDMKSQIPGPGSQEGGEGRGLVLETEPVELEEKQANPAEEYWNKIVHPELKAVGAYLKEAGFAITVPEKPGDFTKEGIEQQINVFINQLVDLGESLKQEKKESTLALAP